MEDMIVYDTLSLNVSSYKSSCITPADSSEKRQTQSARDVEIKRLAERTQ